MTAAPGQPRARPPWSDELASVIGVLQMISGVLAAIYILVHGWSTAVIRSASAIRIESGIGGVSLLAALYFLALAYAGRKLWKDDRVGYYLSAALLAVQVVHVYAPGAQFAVSCPLSFGPTWIYNSEINGGPGWLSGYGLNLVIAWARAVPESSVSVNLIPLFAILYLLFAARRLARKEVARTAQAGVDSAGPAAAG